MGEWQHSGQKVWFEAILYPQRSLGQVGFTILMAVIALLSFAIGLLFYMTGAWPVLGFMGLDVLLVFWAFRVHFKSGEVAEIIRLTRDELKITRIDHRGAHQDWLFNPYWVSLSMVCPPNIPKHNGETYIQLRSHGRGLYLGSFLTQQERYEVMSSLKRALNACRTYSDV